MTPKNGGLASLVHNSAKRPKMCSLAIILAATLSLGLVLSP